MAPQTFPTQVSLLSVLWNGAGGGGGGGRGGGGAGAGSLRVLPPAPPTRHGTSHPPPRAVRSVQLGVPLATQRAWGVGLFLPAPTRPPPVTPGALPESQAVVRGPSLSPRRAPMRRTPPGGGNLTPHAVWGAGGNPWALGGPGPGSPSLPGAPLAPPPVRTENAAALWGAPSGHRRGRAPPRAGRSGTGGGRGGGPLRATRLVNEHFELFGGILSPKSGDTKSSLSSLLLISAW